MPVVSHHTINGRMVAVTMTAQVSLLPDALGSVAATAYDAAAPDLQLRATPYGSALMGNAGWLRYSWVGLYGYRRTDLKHAEMYVRARHYSTTDGAWTSADPLWPDESAYGYVEGKPVLKHDFLGLSGNPSPCDLAAKCGAQDPCAFMNSTLTKGSPAETGVLDCMAAAGFDRNATQYLIDFARRFCLSQATSSGKPSSNGVCLSCPSSGNGYGDLPASCAQKYSGTTTCGDPNLGGFAISPFVPPIVPPSGTKLCTPNKGQCDADLMRIGCKSMIVLCPAGSDADKESASCKQILFHELAHAAGYWGSPDHNSSGGKKNDIVYNFGRCMCKATQPRPYLGNVDPCDKSWGRLW